MKNKPSTMISAEVVLGSEHPNGNRLTTLALTYPRCIHGEVMTHRVFSRNAMSSRAVPVKKMLQQVWSDPFVPLHWGRNQAGMQARSELLGWRRWVAVKAWRTAAKVACVFAWGLSKLGLHKQIANRLLEPFQWMHTLVTADSFSNFFELRDHPDAEPHFQLLAKAMRAAMRDYIYLWSRYGDGHYPYITELDLVFTSDPLDLCQISAARCARVSYLTHDGKSPNIHEDLALFRRLAGGSPMHASPLEHQASPAPEGTTSEQTGNFKYWLQFRKSWEAHKRWEHEHGNR